MGDLQDKAVFPGAMEVTSVLQGLSYGYSAVYLVDLIQGLLTPYALMTNVASDMVDVIRQGTDFEELFRTFGERYVSKEDRAGYLKSTKLSNVVEQLKTNQRYTLTFSRKNSSGVMELVQMSFTRLDTDPAPTKAIMTIKAIADNDDILDDEFASQLYHEGLSASKLVTGQRLAIKSMLGLCDEIYLVDCTTTLVSPLDVSGFVRGYSTISPIKVPFETALRTALGKNIVEEDQSLLTDNLSYAALAGAFGENDNLEYTYHTRNADGSTQTRSIRAVRVGAPDSPDCIVIGFSNGKPAVHEHDAQNEEPGLDHFHIVYDIDLNCGAYRAIRTLPRVKQAIEDKPHVHDALRAIVETLVEASFSSGMSLFLDETTWRERFQSSSILMCEFLSAYAGWCRCSLVPSAYGSDGKPQNVLLMVEAIQAQVTNLNRLTELSEIVSGAGIGTWRIRRYSGQAPALWCDETMLKMLGVDPETQIDPEQLYYVWHFRISGEDRERVAECLDNLEHGIRDEVDFLWLDPVKKEMYMRMGGSCTQVPGKGVVLRGYCYDVERIVKEQRIRSEELNNALAEMEHANRSKTMFLNSMSHDIRTPMNAIMGFTNLAMEHLDDTDMVKNYLEKINTSSAHLLSLINDVLDMSRIESGKVSINENLCHLPNVMHDLASIVQSDLRAKQLSFSINAEDIQNEDVYCDKLRLDQVLINILSNAMKFTQEHGTIKLSVRQTPCEADGRAIYQFTVTDNGIGMSRDFVEHIFEPFEREQTATVSGIQGAGLGMSICKNIVDMMGGTIDVHSKPDVGTSVTVSLRLRVAGEHEGVDTSRLEGLRALVVDDDLDSCAATTKLLRGIGMEVQWATSGKEAVFAAELARDSKDEFALCLVDWAMPDMNGVECTRLLRKVIAPDTPVLLLSAYDCDDVKPEAVDAGVNGFASKPLFASDFIKVIAPSFGLEDPTLDSSTHAADVDKAQFVGKHALLVEDNELNLEIAQTILEQFGIRVTCAANGQEAVDKMALNEYDIVFMDIQMPVMDGLEATRQIRHLGTKGATSIPIVAMTANAFDEDRKEAYFAGVSAYLTKPIEIDRLTEVLAEFL